MSSLIKKSHQRSMDPWKNFFDIDFFNGGWPSKSVNNLPAVNISEDDKSYLVEVVAPGFKKEDFKVKLDDDILTISAETKTETEEEGKNKEYSRREYSYSSFTRSFQMPENAKEEINAKYNDGILKLKIPKKEKETKSSRDISVE